MSSIEQCIRDIARYHTLEEKVRKIISQLGSAAEDVSRLNLHIESNYQVDGDGAAVAARAIELKSELKEIRDYLKKPILPSINSSLQSVKNEKSRLEEEDS